MTCTVSITVSTETAAKLIANSAIGMFPDAAVTMRAGEGKVESYIRRGVCVSLDCKCVAAGVEGHDLPRSTPQNTPDLCRCGHSRYVHARHKGMCIKALCPCREFELSAGNVGQSR